MRTCRPSRIVTSTGRRWRKTSTARALPARGSNRTSLPTSSLPRAPPGARKASSAMSAMFSAPTAIRVLKKHDLSYVRKHDLSTLKHLFLAGEPLDEPTHHWISESLGRPVIDHYWQTETGWPLLSAHPGVERTPIKMGSPSFPVYGYDVRLLHEQTGKPVADGDKGAVAIAPPLPPGSMSPVRADGA